MFPFMFLIIQLPKNTEVAILIVALISKVLRSPKAYPITATFLQLTDVLHLA